METRFSHLYKRDSSVSMIRVKMSRRRSQTQKENRKRMQNLRRHLDQLPELELSMDASTIEKSAISAQETGRKAKTDNSNRAAEERRKMLERFKENKALQKEKERREREKKGTFKVGLYRPQPLGYLPLNPVISSTHKTTETGHTRVTRSMKQQQPKLPSGRQTAPKKAELAPITRTNKPPSAPAVTRGRVAAAEPNVRVPVTRSAAKAVATAGPAKAATKTATDIKTLKTKCGNNQPTAPSSGRGKIKQGNTEPILADVKERGPAEDELPAVKSCSPAEHKTKDPVQMEDSKGTSASFAPQGFLFQAPTGLSTFEPAPLSPRTAEAFLSPSFTFEPTIESTIPDFPQPDSSSPPSRPSDAPPCFSSPPATPCPAPSSPSPPNSAFKIVNPACASPSASACSPPASASHLLPSASSASLVSASPSAPASALSPAASASKPPAPVLASPSGSAPPEPQHDVPYFRAMMVTETQRLTGLSELWESRFDDSSIPEEMRDRMRTAVGQARLLMKERFDQFRGLVDDCDLGRGEKITTCSDLQGFWEMVYFQVEDVNKKFNALNEAESRGWQEEIIPVTRQRKVVKKRPVAGGKVGTDSGASVAAKNRLAAVKAAMKAKKAAPEKAAGTSATAPDEAAPDAPANTLAIQTVVFHGGFFQVESPVKVVGSVRRSSRPSAAHLPQVSPYVSKFSTPSRKQQFTAVSCLSPACTPHPFANPLPCSPRPLHFSPEKHNPHLTNTPQVESNLQATSVFNTMDQSAEKQAQACPSQSDSIPESNVVAASSEQQARETGSLEVDKVISAEAHTSLMHSSPSATSPRIESMEICASVPSEPCAMSITPQQVHFSSPAPSYNGEVCLNKTSPKKAKSETENEEIESIAGLDFELYLQPSASLSSPSAPSPAERFSLELADTEMESPGSHTQEPVQDVLMTPTASPTMAPLVTSWIEQLTDNRLLFTPELRERVRQSVCERDLMMFTPPSSK